VLRRPRLLRLRILLALAACREVAAPGSPLSVQGDVVSSNPGIHLLRQSPAAPRLETYRISFWARRGTQTSVSVHYRRAPGQRFSDELLRFRIPINGLVAGANGVPLQRGDSVRITLTIDTVLFKVDFQPSGVVFSKSSPAQLAIWYKNANPDLNGDGVVDATDAELEQQLAIWSESTTDAWRQLASKHDPAQKLVAAEVQHFCEFAVAY